MFRSKEVCCRTLLCGGTCRWCPPVLSFTSFGLLSGVGLLSEVLSLALSALLFDEMRMTQLTITLMTTHQIATLHLTATRKVQITIPETPTTGPTTEEPSTTCLPLDRFAVLDHFSLETCCGMKNNFFEAKKVPVGESVCNRLPRIVRGSKRD